MASQGCRARPTQLPRTAAWILSARRRPMVARTSFDVDWIVVGSGFGGSVSALRLAEKGYSVRMLETGRRFEDQDFPKSTWNVRKFIWLPRFGLRGVMRLTLYKDVGILSGAGVGGGSLIYANTHYVPERPFFERPEWPDDRDWQEELEPVLRHRQAHARQQRDPVRVRCRSAAQGRGQGPRGRGHLRPPHGWHLLRRTRRDGRGSVLRRRGTRACRVHSLRRLHGGLSPQRQEHPAQELSVSRRAEGRPHRRRANGDRCQSARRGRLRGDKRPRRGLAPPPSAQAPRPRGRRRRRRAWHQPAPTAQQGAGSPAKLSDALGYKVRTNSEALVAVTASEQAL